MDERALIEYVTRQRWYGAKSRTVSHSAVLDTVTIRHAEPQLALALVDVSQAQAVDLAVARRERVVGKARQPVLAVSHRLHHCPAEHIRCRIG